MALVNEYASANDREKYDLAEIYRQFDKNFLDTPSWTIDRENDAFLIWLRASREESTNYQMFAMYWGDCFPCLI